MDKPRFGLIRVLIVLAVIGLAVLWFVWRKPQGPSDEVPWREAVQLRADRRWRIAADQIEQFPGADAVDRPAADARAATWLKVLSEAAPRPSGAGNATEHIPIEHAPDALRRLQRLDAEWTDTTAQRLEAAAVLSELAAISPTYEVVSDPLHARAVVALVFARRAAPEAVEVQRATALLMMAMGYRAEAMRASRELGSDDLIRAFMQRDYQLAMAVDPSDGVEQHLADRSRAALGLPPREAPDSVSEQWARLAEAPQPRPVLGTRLRKLAAAQYPARFQGVSSAPRVEAAWTKPGDEVAGGPWLSGPIVDALADAAFGRGLQNEVLWEWGAFQRHPLDDDFGDLDPGIVENIGLIGVTGGGSPKGVRATLTKHSPNRDTVPFVMQLLPTRCDHREPLLLAIEIAKRSDRRPSSLKPWALSLHNCGDVALAEQFRAEVLDGEPASDPLLGGVELLYQGRPEKLRERILAARGRRELHELVKAGRWAATENQERAGIEEGMRRRVEMQPHHWSARKDLSDYLARRLRFEEALEVVLSFSPLRDGVNAEIHNTYRAIRRARYLRRLGRAEEARAAIEPAVSSNHAGALAEAAWTSLALQDQAGYSRYMEAIRRRYPNLPWLAGREVRALWLHASDRSAAARTVDAGLHNVVDDFVEAMEARDDAGFEAAIAALAETGFDPGRAAMTVAAALQRRGHDSRALLLLRKVRTKQRLYSVVQTAYAQRLGQRLGESTSELPAEFDGRSLLAAYTTGLGRALWAMPVPGAEDHAASLWTYRLAIERSKKSPDPERVREAKARLAEMSGWYGAIGKLIAGETSPEEVAELHRQGNGSPIEFHYWSAVRYALDRDYDAACAQLLNAMLIANGRDGEDFWTASMASWFRTRRMTLERMRQKQIPAAPNARDDFVPTL